MASNLSTSVARWPPSRAGRRTAEREWVDEPTGWYTVIARDRLAENVVENALKGDRVVVHGRLEQRDWTTEAGETRTAWEITAEDLGLFFRLASPAKAESVPEQSHAAAGPARHGRSAAASRTGARARV